MLSGKAHQEQPEIKLPEFGSKHQPSSDHYRRIRFLQHSESRSASGSVRLRWKDAAQHHEQKVQSHCPILRILDCTGRSCIPAVAKRMSSWHLNVKVASEDHPTAGQLPHSETLCWPRLPPWKMMCTFISLTKEAKKKRSRDKQQPGRVRFPCALLPLGDGLTWMVLGSYTCWEGCTYRSPRFWTTFGCHTGSRFAQCRNLSLTCQSWVFLLRGVGIRCALGPACTSCCINTTGGLFRRGIRRSTRMSRKSRFSLPHNRQSYDWLTDCFTLERSCGSSSLSNRALSPFRSPGSCKICWACLLEMSTNSSVSGDSSSPSPPRWNADLTQRDSTTDSSWEANI